LQRRRATSALPGETSLMASDIDEVALKAWPERIAVFGVTVVDETSSAVLSGMAGSAEECSRVQMEMISVICGSSVIIDRHDRAAIEVSPS
jgi:hypothetical protein